MQWLVRFFKSSIGAKVMMATTGVILVGWIFAHMVGNLQVYMGQETFNNYAAFLKGNVGLLWSMRIGMVVFFVLHIAAGIRLTRLNRKARSSRYAMRSFEAARPNGRWMIYSGLLVFAFFAYHIAHFTLGLTHPHHFGLTDALGRHDAYSMFVHGFRQPGVAASYIIAMVLLGMHLSHGVSSMFQSIGLTSSKWTPLINKAGPAFATIFVLGNISMPIAVLTGVVTLPGV